MKKFLILIALFLIAISKKCGPWEKFDEKTQKCECKYAQNIKTRKCVPPSRLCKYGTFEDGRCKPIPEYLKRCPKGLRYVNGKCIRFCRYGSDPNGKCNPKPHNKTILNKGNKNILLIFKD